MSPRSRLIFVVLGAAFFWFLAFGPLTLGPITVEAQQVAQTQPERFERWINPTTGETVRLRFDGQKTTLERGEKVEPIVPKPFDEVTARAQMQEAQDFLTRWDVMSVPRWRRQWITQFKSLDEAKKAFVAIGFPLKLWDDIDTFGQAVGEGTPQQENRIPEAYAGSLTLEGGGTITVHSATGQKTIRLSNPEWKNNLLVNPTPEITQLYAKINGTSVEIARPTPQAQAEIALWEQSNRLAQQGFIRMSPRRPDGSLWLPPALEPHRTELKKLERPVVRPYVKVGKPALWESKFGGVPYRPNGSAWPVGRSGKPLHFLAQLDLGEANRDGTLPDLPRKGLLQFFLSYPDAAYEQKHPTGNPVSGYARVIYWPEVIKDAAALTQEIPDYGRDEDIDEMFHPPEHAMGFVKDTEIPSSLDDRLSFTTSPEASSGTGPAYEAESNNAYLQPNGHRLRGYPMVINTYHPAAEDIQLLFQFDGDDYGGQLFGENGAMGGWLGFFIKPADLKKLNFSRVWLEMDAF